MCTRAKLLKKIAAMRTLSHKDWDSSAQHRECLSNQDFNLTSFLMWKHFLFPCTWLDIHGSPEHDPVWRS